MTHYSQHVLHPSPVYLWARRTDTRAPPAPGYSNTGTREKRGRMTHGTLWLADNSPTPLWGIYI